LAGNHQTPRTGESACLKYGQSTANKCPNGFFAVVKNTEQEHTTIKKIFIPCGTYKCPVCSKKRKQTLFKMISKSCQKKDFLMLTLTLRKNQYGLKYNWQRINHAWDILLKQLKRRFPKVKYFRCVELQKNGMPHIHALINCYLSKWEIKKIWETITGDSFICKFEEVRSSCAGYILKYFYQSVGDIEKIRKATGRKTKIFNWSRNFLYFEIRDSKWELIKLCQTESEAFDEIHYQQIKARRNHGRFGPLIAVEKENNRISSFMFMALWEKEFSH
jgi:hypothetical protein